jgi:predicted RNase H-like HicB family nuclease
MPRIKRDASTLTPPPVPHAPDRQHAPDAPVAPEVEARIQELMRRPYRITVQADPDDGGYIARVQEIPECIGAGDTLEETVQLLREAMEGWFLVSIEHG